MSNESCSSVMGVDESQITNVKFTAKSEIWVKLANELFPQIMDY